MIVSLMYSKKFQLVACILHFLKKPAIMVFLRLKSQKRHLYKFTNLLSNDMSK